MQELIGRLTENANLSPEQAQQAVDVVRNFLSDKLPDPIAGPVMSALEGEDAGDQLSSAVDGLKGKLFGDG